MRIKICGLTRQEDIDCVNQLRPDFCGFVFAPESRRFLVKERARKLKRRLNPAILAVGVFVNADPGQVAEYCREEIIDAVQLHGQEDETYIRMLRGYTKCPVIQAFSVKTERDLLRAEKSIADYVLLDNGSGGTGQRFDWQILTNFSRPFFLAGGISPENIEEAVQSHPWGVDISSGVETDGLKDPLKIETCIRRIRNV